MLGEKQSNVTANPKESVECLFSRPRPTSTPNHSQSRESPVRTMRAITRMQAVQNNDSKTFIVMRPLMTSTAGHNRTASRSDHYAQFS